MTVSRSSARDLERFLGFPEHRIDVVTEGADPVFRVIEDPSVGARAKASQSIPPTTDLLVYVGGFNRHKNVRGLLDAMPDVIARRPNAYLAVVGSTTGKGFWDEVSSLRALVASDPVLERHVRFTGHISDEELVGLLSGAAALVFPSLWEGFGLPALEAMSCGVPVLASDRGSLPEVVGDAGLLFDPRDPAAISECVVRFLSDATLRQALAARALERSRDFSWARAAELAEACFKRTYADAGRRTAASSGNVRR